MRSLVVGSGPAAYAAALAVSARGGTVALLRRARPGGERIYGEHLAPGAKAHLAQLGLLDILCPPRHRPSHGITTLWGAAAPFTRDYLFNPYGCGWNLDRDAFDGSLADEASRRGVRLVDITHIETVQRTGRGWELAAATPRGRALVAGHFLIDATGRRAVVARKLRLRGERHDRLVGLYARLESVACQDDHLLLESAPDGWWYSVPLSGDVLVAVFMTDSDLLPAGAAARARHWLARLETSTATRARTGRLPCAVTLHVAPSGSQCLSAHAGPDWLAVGDASMAFDPLAADGIAKALEDGLNAAQHVEQALGAGGWSPEEYTKMRNSAYCGYLDARTRYYGMEQRWAQSPFWRRRNCPTDGPGGRFDLRRSGGDAFGAAPPLAL